MTPLRIQVHALGKRFMHRGAQPPLTWRNLLGGWRRPRARSFWALRGVSFTVKAGEMLGIIGRNGAGKSTLLNLLGGIVHPDAGTLSVDGRVGGLLELGGSFMDDLTGRENALLAGVAAGLTRRQVYSRLDDIVAFAEMAEFLDQPVRTYSSGMRMRLAFSVAVHTGPDVLLVDEYLSVGDISFQARCRARICEMRNLGCAVVLVSHGMAEVRETCDRALWLRAGQVAAFDSPAAVTELYESEMHQRTLALSQNDPASLPARPGGASERIGSGEMEIVDVAFRSGRSIRSGSPFLLEVTYRSERPGLTPIFVVSITAENGTVCIDTNTQAARVSTEHLSTEGVVRFSIPRLELGNGRYFANVGIFESDWHHAYDHRWHAYPFFVDGAAGHRGPLAPPCRWNTAEISVDAPAPAPSKS